jgi:putative transposase
VLLEDGPEPLPVRSQSSWRAFLRAQAASRLGCDFLTVETALLQRIYVLFFISLASRRIEYIVATSNPDGRWVTQQARNLIMRLGDEHPFRFVVHDRDTKFTRGFDEIFRAEGIKVIRTPIKAPNANAHAERWIRTLRADCLDRILILGRRHLEHVLRVYRHHYNEHRPLQGLTNRDVASKAFMSPKTVQANLTRIYRKLGIRSRAELGARMAEESRRPTTQK